MSELYEYHGFTIPARMMPAIHAYVDEGRVPGDFLCAVIINDLCKACAHADIENAENIPAYIGYFYNEVPAACWGSVERMNKWVAGHASARQEKLDGVA